MAKKLAFFVSVLLTAVGHAQTSPTNLPYTLEAEEVNYDDEAGTITAKGDVLVTHEKETIQTDQILYMPKADILNAEGNVTYDDGKGQRIYVEKLEVSNGMDNAKLEKLRLEVPELGEILQAEEGVKLEETYSLKGSVYSPCPLCEKGLLEGRKAWQVRAKDVTYNQPENEMVYRHATLDVYGVPVLYTPYFKHPVDRTRPENGMLFPRFGHSTNLGDELTLAYYHYLPESNSDYTVRTRYMSSRGLMGQLERRQAGEQLDTEVRTTFIQDDRRDTWRSSAKVEGEYVFQKGRRLGLNGELASDDTYLADFFSRTDSYLPNTLYFEDTSNDHYFSLYGTYFQDLDTSRDPANTAQILPRVQFEKLWQTDPSGGRFIVEGDALVLSRSRGDVSRRIVGSVEYLKPFDFGGDDFWGGNRLTYSAKLRTDYYNTEQDTVQDGNVFRVLPETSLLWEKPMSSGYHTITPMAKAVLAPRGGNPSEIPNEDSVAYELDANNLFSTNRYAGLDRVESGPRVIYGLDNSWGSQNGHAWRLFLGQSYRFVDDNTVPLDGGTETKGSDFVGYFRASPVDWFAASSLFRIDNANGTARRMDNDMRIGAVDDLNFRLIHTKVQNGVQELQARLFWPVSEKWDFEAKTRRDINDGGRQLEGETSLTYKHSCFNASLVVRRRGFTTVDLQPSTDYLFNIELLTLGQERD